jgi:hypothetical protein
MTRTRLIANVTAVALTMAMAFTGSLLQPVEASDAHSPGYQQWNANLDAAASAIPTSGQPSATDQEADLLRVRQRSAKSTAVSTATSNCDGCHGEAITVQVIYFDGAGPNAADNIATAVSQCKDCSSTAASLQLVFAKQSDQLIVNNRALSINAACDGCATNATAIQLVYVGGARRDLSAATKTLVASLQATLADQIGSAPAAKSGAATAQVQSDVNSVADQLEAIVWAETGSSPIQRNIDIQAGS